MAIFRGQTAQIQIGGITVGVLQDAEINPSKNVEELRGQSIKRADAQQTELNVAVSATHASFNLQALKDILGYDETNDEIEDTPEVPTFTVTGTFTSTDGSEDFDMAVQNVYFDDLNLSWDPDSHVTKDVSGTGDDIVFTDNTV